MGEQSVDQSAIGRARSRMDNEACWLINDDYGGVFEDDFETDKGWTASGAGAGQGVWQRLDPFGTTWNMEQAGPEDGEAPPPLEQLFDASADPRELRDLSAREPEKLEEMRQDKVYWGWSNGGSSG